MLDDHLMESYDEALNQALPPSTAGLNLPLASAFCPFERPVKGLLRTSVKHCGAQFASPLDCSDPPVGARPACWSPVPTSMQPSSSRIAPAAAPTSIGPTSSRVSLRGPFPGLGVAPPAQRPAGLALLPDQAGWRCTPPSRERDRESGLGQDAWETPLPRLRASGLRGLLGAATVAPGAGLQEPSSC